MEPIEREYELEFIGRTRVKAFTLNEAKKKLLESNDIKASEKVRFKTIWYDWFMNFFRNIPAFATTTMMIILVTLYVQAINAIETITSPELHTIALLGLITLIMVVPFKIARFTKWIYRTFDIIDEKEEIT